MIVLKEETFLNSTMTDIANIIFGIGGNLNDNFSEKAHTKTISDFDEESRYYYNELLKERATKSIKSMLYFGIIFSK